LWRAAKKSEVLEEAMNKARNQASGFENGIRTQFRSILNNKRARKGFTPSEISAMQKVVRGGKAENIFKALGKFGLTDGQTSQMLMGSVGIGLGASVGGATGAIAVPLAGQVSKRLAQRMTSNNAKFADTLIRAGDNSLSITKAYMRTVKRNQRSPEELAEIFMLKRADLSKIKESIDTVPRHSRQVVEDALLIAAGQNAAASL